MTRSRIDKTTLEDQLPAILREQFRRDGFPPDHMPSWKYITANTRYSAYGLHLKCNQLYDQTLCDFLRERGFGTGNNGEWPTDDEETIRSLEYYTNSLVERRKLSEAVTDTAKATVERVYEAIKEEGLETELLDIARYSSESERLEQVQYVLTIIEYMDERLDDGTMENYMRHFEDYYNVVSNKHQVDFNPVVHAVDEFDWYRSEGDPQPITESQLIDLWNTLDALTECPVRGYNLEQWRCWMKILIVFLISVGPRSNEVERFDVRTQFHFGDDPYVHFDERKNLRRNEGPEKVPIMFGAQFLKAYRDYIEAIDGNGSLVPSSRSQSGCRTSSTLNSWLQRLCEEADVRLEDGEFPTMKNFRQFWTTRYKEAVHENRKQIKFVSQEKGTKNPEVDEDNYIDEKKNRQHIRELGRKQFSDVLDLGELPDLIQNELNQNDYLDRQTTITEFSTDI
jgi:hypothetical protein